LLAYQIKNENKRFFDRACVSSSSSLLLPHSLPTGASGYPTAFRIFFPTTGVSHTSVLNKFQLSGTPIAAIHLTLFFFNRPRRRLRTSHCFFFSFLLLELPILPGNPMLRTINVTWDSPLRPVILVICRCVAERWRNRLAPRVAAPTANMVLRLER